MIDREKVIKGLECCRFGDNDGIHSCAECPYQASEEEMHHLDWNCHIDDMVNDINDLLKAQDIVRCKDCKHQDPDRLNDGSNCYVCRKGHGWKPDDWFCADGERR